MVWDQLSINKPHLVYIILGGFTSIFMLISLIIKEKLYVGEATVATVVGLIFGPHAANLIDPLTWGNTDQITLEFSRIVLVVQCFAVGVELPKAYMERHWLSVALLLIPVMTWGWLITSLFMWWMIEPLTWLESLTCAACVTATDPVLASSVVGKGKFAKRVPKHIRDLLSAESGCNDGMAFPFIYLALNLIHYNLSPSKVTYHWICNTILYECVWGVVYGVLVGYIARHAIKYADRKKLIDRESFLVFYFVLALFCAGSGSLLGMDDLLVGFAAGVGFSNDGWFQEKTEESHVSNVIDLLLNLTYFVYLGTIIPWDQFNNGVNGLEAWRLVVIAIMVILFRRIPIMLALKSFIPDIKTWREALFCGHFGPIGVGAIFVAILARAELETKSTTPLANPPGPGEADYVLIYVIWPLTTFLVLSSIVVHGSSIAVFTLGKRINTLTLTLSYTTANDQASSWMNRLPRISSMGSKGKSFDSRVSDDDGVGEKENFDASKMPKLQLRRQKEEEEYEQPDRKSSRSHSRSRSRDRKSKKNYGGPISESAYGPALTPEPTLTHHESGSDTLIEKSDQRSPERGEKHKRQRSSSSSKKQADVRSRNGSTEEQPSNSQTTHSPGESVEVEVYEEGDEVVVEDEEGNVIETLPIHGRGEQETQQIVEDAKNKVKADRTGNFVKHKHESHPRDEGDEVEDNIKETVTHPERHFRDAFKGWKGFSRRDGGREDKPERKRGPAHAFQIGNTVIVEDEDGEVIKTFTLPRNENDPESTMRRGMQRMGTFVGLNRKESRAPSSGPVSAQTLKELEEHSTEDKSKAEREDLPIKKENTTKTGETSDHERRKSEDDGLRMVISRTEEYGLTGLRKPRTGERPDVISMGGRRLSTKDFLAQMQQLDRSTRQEKMEQAGVGKDTKNEVYRRANETRGLTWQLRRSGTTQFSKADENQIQEEEPQDYFSQQPLRRSRGRAVSDTSGGNAHRTSARRTLSGDSQTSNKSAHVVEDAEEVPRHDVRSSISRHNRRSGAISAAEARRQRYAPQAQTQRIDEQIDEDEEEKETAAEAKRRRAALGEEPYDAQSSSEDDGEPRSTKAVQPPHQEGLGSLDESQRPQAARIQWGNAARGALREQGDEEAQLGPRTGEHKGRGNMKRILTNLLNR